MGDDRKKYSKQQATKISVSIRNEFNIDLKDIYNVWCDYNFMKKENMSMISCIQIIKKNYSDAIFNYFIAMSLELINTEIIKGNK